MLGCPNSFGTCVHTHTCIRTRTHLIAHAGGAFQPHEATAAARRVLATERQPRQVSRVPCVILPCPDSPCRISVVIHLAAQPMRPKYSGHVSMQPIPFIFMPALHLRCTSCLRGRLHVFTYLHWQHTPCVNFTLACPRPMQVHDGSFTPTEQFTKDPDSLCSTISWRDEDDRVIWVFKTQVRVHACALCVDVQDAGSRARMRTLCGRLCVHMSGERLACGCAPAQLW